MAIPEKKPYERLSDYLERSLPAELEAGKSRGKATADIISKFNEEPPREMFAPFIWGYANNASSGDDDANTYIAAIQTGGGTLSGAEETAIDNFFVGLKSDGIYSKISVMYPFLGSVANSNKINAINPGTNDLTFNGTWTHSATGSYATKTSSDYADTGFNMSASFDMTTDNCASLIIADRLTSPTFGYSGIGTDANNYFFIECDGNSVGARNQGGAKAQVNLGSSTQPGVMAVNSRIGASSWYVGGILSGSAASSGFSFNSRTDIVVDVFDGNYFINQINSAGFPDGGRYMFTHIGNGLSTTEADNLLTRVNDLQTAFNRNIFA